MKSYAELKQRTDAPAGSTWGLWGEADDIGTVNLLTAERVLRASTLVRRGAVFSLDIPLNAFDPALSPKRGAMEHIIFALNDNHRDDRLNNFYLQGTSQLDGLRHFRHPQHGFYNGARSEDITVGNPQLGVQRWAEHGIAGRGILLDVDRYFRSQGRILDHMSPEPISVADLERVAAEQQVEFEPGDILLFRTGWLKAVLAQDAEERQRLSASLVNPGLEQSEEMLAWLWDRQFAVVAADNVAVEAYPVADSSPFLTEAEAVGEGRTAHSGMLHRQLVPLVGLALGEMWSLDALAEDCTADGVWEFMVVSNPMMLTGGVGSPPNAVAMK